MASEVFSARESSVNPINMINKSSNLERSSRAARRATSSINATSTRIPRVARRGVQGTSMQISLRTENFSKSGDFTKAAGYREAIENRARSLMQNATNEMQRNRIRRATNALLYRTGSRTRPFV